MDTRKLSLYRVMQEESTIVFEEIGSDIVREGVI
jgi:hypothetical protein